MELLGFGGGGAVAGDGVVVNCLGVVVAGAAVPAFVDPPCICGWDSRVIVCVSWKVPKLKKSEF
jgi:hypothetical protein